MSVQSAEKESLVSLTDPPDSSSGERAALTHSDSLISSIPPAPDNEKSIAWRIGGVLRTMRPHQWVKNVFVLAPVVFAKDLFELALISQALGAFVVFCLLAGAIYTINDIADIESDRLHPVKRHRPIASGRVPLRVARVLSLVLTVAALSGALLASPAFLVVAALYFGLNVAYSMKLKHVAYLDVGCIATGFVLRVVGGGYATDIAVSNYLLLCTALLALFLGFGKRRHELATAELGRARRQRVVLESYTKPGLDAALWVTALATLGTYVAYTLDRHTRQIFKSDWLWLSSLFVVLGVLRFLHLVRYRPKSESPTQEMLKDGPFVAIVLLWVILVIWMVYNLRPGG